MRSLTFCSLQNIVTHFKGNRSAITLRLTPVSLICIHPLLPLVPPKTRGSNWFYFFNTGLQAQSVLYVSKKPEGPGTIVLDPNTLSTDGTVALAGYSMSEDGTHMAYGLSSSGSDWQSIRCGDGGRREGAVRDNRACVL